MESDNRLDIRSYTAGQRLAYLASLIFAGEMIFGLPFHIIRFFRPTFLEVFGLSHTELGLVFSVYGFTAMIAYLPGGMLADRFSARLLMMVSLVLTALGGLVLLLIPGKTVLYLLFGWWGITTIFMFWAPMIKATRSWGGQLTQGRAFGWLDGGRGLVAALFAIIAVEILSFWLPLPGLSEASDRKKALQWVIAFYSLLTLLSAVFIEWFLPKNPDTTSSTKFRLKLVSGALFRKAIVLQALIVVLAYCAYKALDYYPNYAIIAMGMDEVEASGFVSKAAFLRLFGAVAAGYWMDRTSAARVIKWLFLALAMLSIWLAFIEKASSAVYLWMYFNIALSFLAVYGLRGVYFGLLEETKVPPQLTGTAVGIISLLGFTPDVFFHPLAGYILDQHPGMEGFRWLFVLIGTLSSAGALIALILAKQRFKAQTSS